MCSYCGCRSIDVIGRFSVEHDDVINLTTALRHAREQQDPAAAATAARAIAESLDPHTHAEEVGLFTVMKRDPDYTEHIERLCHEHVTLDQQIADIEAGNLDAIDGFINALRAHIDHEENGLFPAAAVGLTGDDWDEIDALTPDA